MTPATRFRAALATLGRSAASLAPLLRCHPRTVQGWCQAGAPDEILSWVEDGARETRAWLDRMPEVRIVAGKPRGLG